VKKLVKFNRFSIIWKAYDDVYKNKDNHKYIKKIEKLIDMFEEMDEYDYYTLTNNVWDSYGVVVMYDEDVDFSMIKTDNNRIIKTKYVELITWLFEELFEIYQPKSENDKVRLANLIAYLLDDYYKVYDDDIEEWIIMVMSVSLIYLHPSHLFDLMFKIEKPKLPQFGSDF
jgi:iron-sulfur cluster repair protein YtfE (RIC family)